MYDIEEFNGELCRLNISCFHNLPLSGCVFFKIIAIDGNATNNAISNG